MSSIYITAGIALLQMFLNRKHKDEDRKDELKKQVDELKKELENLKNKN